MDLWDSGLKFDKWICSIFLIGLSDGVMNYLYLIAVAWKPVTADIRSFIFCLGELRFLVVVVHLQVECYTCRLEKIF